MSKKSGATSARPSRSWGGRLLKAAWLLLAVAIVAVAVWSFWVYVGTDQRAAAQARDAIEQFEASCATGDATGTGTSETDAEVIGLLSFPGHGEESWPILAGTGADELGAGVGWYPQTAGVGEVGNTVLAGYRITHGAPFANLLDLNEGDRVEITTCTDVFSYELDVAPRELTVQSGDDWVLDAVPGDSGKRPTGQMITLVTSQDLLPTKDRSVGVGHLISSEPR
ncbi:sortase [Propionimicrobium sp. PCR01-08-3]|uniref:sortase domain-containing protein n=1 Tax=Propionimicrobium sp. PCR01-08-3 TaxID=3052086 RepID=UPI00255D0DE5|nr:sortase [Propionimicrobium sp. PCR01-08-3]WIY82324.1 sortase [Propionimicrobium sp. PCR01-08-3]